MGTTVERDVLYPVLSSPREGLPVMELELRRLSTAFAGVALVRAAPGVALENGAPDRGGHVSSALARSFRCVLRQTG